MKKFKEIMGKIARTTAVWAIRLIFFVIIGYTLFIICKSLYTISQNGLEARELNKRKAELLETIRRDSILLEQLNHDEYIEKFAREKYNMRREADDVYLIE